MPFNLYAGPLTMLMIVGPAIVLTALAVCGVGLQGISGSVGFSSELITPNDATSTNTYDFINTPRGACGLFIKVGATGGNIAYTATAQQGP